MTRIDLLNFPSKFAVFRRFHNALAFQIIISNEHYQNNNTYYLENENIENSSMFQRVENVSLTMLPHQINSSVNIFCEMSNRPYRVCWNCSGLFIKIVRNRPSNPVVMIPVITISDYNLLPSITQNSICFIEDIFTESVRNVLNYHTDSEMSQWLRLEQLLCNWFNYSHRSNSPTFLRYVAEGPDDQDDRLTIPRGQLVGALPHRRRRMTLEREERQERLERLRERERMEEREQNEREQRIRDREREQRDTRNQRNQNAVGAGSGSASNQPPNPTRLQKFTIDAIIEYAVNTETTCPISMEPITRDNAGVLSCQHVFAKDSIERWLSSNTVCPLCRETSILC